MSPDEDKKQNTGPRVCLKVWSICSNNHLGVGGLLLEISSREEESSSLPILERSTADVGENKNDSGAIEKKIEDGVRLMGRGAEHIKLAIHLELQDGDSVLRSLIRPCHRGPFWVSSNGGGRLHGLLL
ncbi:hypothetical protein CASFOL_002445 [Castilleja foliolosa]|uniref:Uncharacterized protein n=1 Tax=Castilleja foliolosa TaxID=1961234 RepID=A0ABD3EHT7_9LAMI